MRAFIVVLALVAAPFLAAVSQSPQGSDCDNGLGDEHRSDSGQVHAHQGLCAPQPPPSCGNSDLVTGIATIRGQVFTDQPPWTLLGGWCVELQDASSGAVVGTALTTATSLDGLAGNKFLFVNVPAGAHIIWGHLLDATRPPTEPPRRAPRRVDPDLKPKN